MAQCNAVNIFAIFLCFALERLKASEELPKHHENIKTTPKTVIHVRQRNVDNIDRGKSPNIHNFQNNRINFITFEGPVSKIDIKGQTTMVSTYNMPKDHNIIVKQNASKTDLNNSSNNGVINYKGQDNAKEDEGNFNNYAQIKDEKLLAIFKFEDIDQKDEESNIKIGRCQKQPYLQIKKTNINESTRDAQYREMVYADKKKLIKNDFLEIVMNEIHCSSSDQLQKLTLNIKLKNVLQILNRHLDSQETVEGELFNKLQLILEDLTNCLVKILDSIHKLQRSSITPSGLLNCPNLVVLPSATSSFTPMTTKTSFTTMSQTTTTATMSTTTTSTPLIITTTAPLITKTTLSPIPTKAFSISTKTIVKPNTITTTSTPMISSILSTPIVTTTSSNSKTPSTPTTTTILTNPIASSTPIASLILSNSTTQTTKINITSRFNRLLSKFSNIPTFPRIPILTKLTLTVFAIMNELIAPTGITSNDMTTYMNTTDTSSTACAWPLKSIDYF